MDLVNGCKNDGSKRFVNAVLEIGAGAAGTSVVDFDSFGSLRGRDRDRERAVGFSEDLTVVFCFDGVLFEARLGLFEEGRFLSDTALFTGLLEEAFFLAGLLANFPLLAESLPTFLLLSGLLVTPSPFVGLLFMPAVFDLLGDLDARRRDGDGASDLRPLDVERDGRC